MRTRIELSDDDVKLIKGYLPGKKTVSQFVYEATIEKVHRLEKRNERSKRERLQGDIEAMREVLESLLREKGLIE